MAVRSAVLLTVRFRPDKTVLPLFDIDIQLIRFGEADGDVLLYNMHDNENTSALAGRVFAEKYAGEYYELIHTGKRNLSFLHGEDSVHVDPNRIYTDTGIWLQLEKNEITDTLIFTRIANWRDSLLAILRPEDRLLVIALHNNTANNYSYKSYQPGEEYADEAQDLSRGSICDKDDFFFVTDIDQFERLSDSRYNVVLQSTITLTDDGSLSVYCYQRGIPYINVEAQHGHLTRQIKMLVYAYRDLIEDTYAGGEDKQTRRSQKKKLRELIRASKS